MTYEERLRIPLMSLKAYQQILCKSSPINTRGCNYIFRDFKAAEYDLILIRLQRLFSAKIFLICTMTYFTAFVCG